MRTRLLLGTAGVVLMLFGLARIVTQTPHHALLVLVVWLVAAVIVHDVVLSAVLLGVASGLSRVVPARALPFVQGGLLAAALVTVIALPLIYRQRLYPASKALLRQDYRINLAILLVLVLLVTAALYLVALVRTRATKQRSASDQDSVTS